jgi:hypothetical protein
MDAAGRPISTSRNKAAAWSPSRWAPAAKAERRETNLEEPMAGRQGEEGGSQIYSFAVELLEQSELSPERALEPFVDRVFQHDASRGRGLVSKIEMRGPALYYLQRVARKLRKQG